MTDLFAAIPVRPEKANGEFLAHLIDLRQGRITKAQLMNKCPDANREIVEMNLRFWRVA